MADPVPSHIGGAPKPSHIAATAKALPGYEIVEDFGDGSAIYKSLETGRESFVDQTSGYSSPDPAVIEAARESKGRGGPGQRSQVGMAGQAIRDSGVPGAQTIMNIGDYFPVFRGMAPGIAEATSGGAISKDFYDMAVEDYQQTYPVRSAVEGIGATAPLALLAGLPTVAGNVLRRGVVGGIGGGVGAGLEGLLSGYLRGGEEQAVEEGKAGAVGGAAFGFGLPFLGAGVSSLYGRYLEKPVRDVLEEIGFKGKAAEIAKEALELDAAGAVENVGSAGPYGTVADLGPNTASLLDSVANSPGAGAAIVRKNLNETAKEASQDLSNTMDDVLGAPTGDVVSQKRTIMKDSADARGTAYDDAYDVNVDINTPEGQTLTGLVGQIPDRLLNDLNETLQIQGLPPIGKVKRLSEAELNRMAQSGQSLADMNIRSLDDGSYLVGNIPTIENIDDLSRVLYDMGMGITKDPGQRMALQTLAMQLRQAADAVSPAFATARAEGKAAIDQRIAADLGDTLLNPKVTRREAAELLDAMGPTELKQVKQALRNRIDEIGANARKPITSNSEQEVIEALAQLRAMNTRAVASKLRTLLGPEDFAKFEGQIQSTTGALMMNASIAQNSKTAIRQAVERRFREIMGSNIAEELGEKGIFGLPAAKAAQSIAGPTQSERVMAVGEELAPILTQRMSPDDLLRQAQSLEAAAPAIARGRRGRQQARDVVTSLGAPGVLTQGEEDSPTRRLLNSLGIGL